MTINENLFRALLVTTGRISKQPHIVTLRGVKYNDKIYFSRHEPNSDWFKNVKINPNVSINFNGSLYPGIAKIVTEKNLNLKISQLKYPGEKRAQEKRVAIEITLHE